MKAFMIIYTHPDNDQVGSLVVKAADQDDSFMVAAKQLMSEGHGDVDIIVSIPATASARRWTCPAADGWKLCNVEDYLKSMEEEVNV